MTTTTWWRTKTTPAKAARRRQRISPPPPPRHRPQLLPPPPRARHEGSLGTATPPAAAVTPAVQMQRYAYALSPCRRALACGTTSAQKLHVLASRHRATAPSCAWQQSQKSIQPTRLLTHTAWHRVLLPPCERLRHLPRARALRKVDDSRRTAHSAKSESMRFGKSHKKGKGVRAPFGQQRVLARSSRRVRNIQTWLRL